MTSASGDAANQPWTVRRVLTWTSDHFKKKDIESPRLTAEVLLAHTLKVDRVRLYVDLDRPLSKDELGTFKAFIERRCVGEPTQYLTGTREFYNRAFFVDPRVLVPRPETELLAEAALRFLPKDAPSKALDLCTGSGCLAITVAAERASCSVVAVDVSPDALEVARRNGEANAVMDRVTWLLGDLFQPVTPGDRFDVIVSNPPYIVSAEIEGLSAEVRKEPRLALDGGQDGLQLVRRIIDGAQAHLVPGGQLALEIGETQGPQVAECMTRAGFQDVRVEKDLARLDRLVLGKAP